MDAQGAKVDNETKDQEIVSLRKKILELESQLGEAQKLIQKHLMEVNEVDLLKMKSADTLTKAKSVIFENTKMIKNQELQINALHQQVESLRDVVKITKDLLEIRNLEVDQLESKIHCMEEKYKAEKERQDLMHQKLEQMIRHNGELKREYEAQLCLFQALRSRYDERELAKGVVDALKEDIKVDKQKQAEQKKIESTVNESNKNDEKTVTNSEKKDAGEVLQNETKVNQNTVEDEKIVEKTVINSEKKDAGDDMQNETKINQNTVEVQQKIEVAEQTETFSTQGISIPVKTGDGVPEQNSTSAIDKSNPSILNAAETTKNESENSQINSGQISMDKEISSSTPSSVADSQCQEKL